MARISAFIMAVATAIVGVQAASCPNNGVDSFYCGSQLLDVFKCKCRLPRCRRGGRKIADSSPGTDKATLQALNPDANVNTSIYVIGDDGKPFIFALDCKPYGGCSNAGPNGRPQAHCFQ